MAKFYGDSASRCEYLLLKYGPLFMAGAGGPLEDECEENFKDGAKEAHRPPTVITNHMIKQMVTLYAPPKNYRIAEIAGVLHISPSTVLRHLKIAGAWMPGRRNESP